MPHIIEQALNHQSGHKGGGRHHNRGHTSARSAMHWRYGMTTSAASSRAARARSHPCRKLPLEAECGRV
jgi:hypothetical protein